MLLNKSSMKLSFFKNLLGTVNELTFKLPDGSIVAPHFHVTEVGQIDKRFIDCGGTLRLESVINFQLWEANDYDHRLAASKLTSIIELSEQKLNLGDFEIEVEYQGNTIQKFGLDYDGKSFQLTSLTTDCLAKDKCGIPVEKPKVRLSELSNQNSCCTPGSGCC